MSRFTMFPPRDGCVPASDTPSLDLNSADGWGTRLEIGESISCSVAAPGRFGFVALRRAGAVFVAAQRAQRMQRIRPDPQAGGNGAELSCRSCSVEWSGLEFRLQPVCAPKDRLKPELQPRGLNRA